MISKIENDAKAHLFPSFSLSLFPSSSHPSRQLPLHASSLPSPFPIVMWSSLDSLVSLLLPPSLPLPFLSFSLPRSRSLDH